MSRTFLSQKNVSHVFYTPEFQKGEHYAVRSIFGPFLPTPDRQRPFWTFINVQFEIFETFFEK